MVLALAAKALLALLVFGMIRYIDVVVDYLVGSSSSGMELDVPADEEQ